MKILKFALSAALLIPLSIQLFAQPAPPKSFRLDGNKLNIPFDNRGVIATVDVPPLGPKATLGSFGFLYSGGFLLTGKSGGKRFVNGMALSSSIAHYQPGPVGSEPADTKNGIYIVKKTDSPFSESWQQWKDAVALGANYYDGNMDGKYDPIDLNGNREWDMTEDKPEILGDVTAWCVYNDGVRSSERGTFSGTEPQGIEIRQTIFEYTADQSVERSAFVRYEIVNKSQNSEKMDSVYFSIWTDPDLGNPQDDLMGSDTPNGAVYAYGKTAEQTGYPPVFHASAFSTPVRFVPGRTFTDTNANGLFDAGTDIPLDTAQVINGIYGMKQIPGAENTPVYSSVCYSSEADSNGALIDKDEILNLIYGKLPDGSQLSPCDTTQGTVLKTDCSTIDSRYWFSGNLAARTGWQNTKKSNKRMMLNMGPFSLKKNEPSVVYACYSASAGSAYPSSSVAVLINTSKNAQNKLKSDIEALPKMFIHSYEVKGYGFSLPMENTGVLKDGKYNNNVFIFSGGFLLSGVARGMTFANGVAASSQITDYIPGHVMHTDEQRYKIFTITSNQPENDFSGEWNDWKYAVENGADYYDGNNDGKYDPIDLNGNGRWDTNEDRPDMLGDVTAWCIYNDGVPSEKRLLTDQSPLGIEIKQTVYAFTNTSALRNTMLIKYELNNTGLKADTLNSVSFGLWNDPDIGDPVDDLNGYDMSLNSGIAYQKKSDSKYGANPPAFMSTLLQGPYEFISGETFSDNNANGVYDKGTDTALDTAYVFNSIAAFDYLRDNTSALPYKEIPGAMNVGPAAFISYIMGSPPIQDPKTTQQVRFYMNGRTNDNTELSPCSWKLGSVYGADCQTVDPHFWYAGDPVSGQGWLNTKPSDIRMLQSTAYFTLVKNKPQTIYAAYTVKSGTSPLNSVTEAKAALKDAVKYLHMSFPNPTTDVENNTQTEQMVKNYALYQNYPNPFNPSTTIKFSLPEESTVELKVFDILGREVTTLIGNTLMRSGTHEAAFNAQGLASGIYIYRLKAGGHLMTRSMMMVK